MKSNNYRMKKKLDYKKMVKEIDKLVETDFCFDMDCRTLPHSSPYTQKEAIDMASIIGSVYMIAHAIHCDSPCQNNYLISRKN